MTTSVSTGVIEYTGQIGTNIRTAKISTNALYSEVVSPGFCNHIFGDGVILDTDWFEINFKGGQALFKATIDSLKVVTLYPLTNYVIDPVADHIAVYADAIGGLTADANPAVNLGNIQAGKSGTADSLISYPPTVNSGFMAITASNNAGDYSVNLTNTFYGQPTNLSIVDPLVANGSILSSANPIADPSANLIYVEASILATTLNSGNKIIFNNSGFKQYKILNLTMGLSTNFSGGDRLVRITDGTTTWTTLASVYLTSQSNQTWGPVGSPVPWINTAYNQSPTAAGQNIYATYFGGTANYTSGIIICNMVLARVV